MKLENILLDPVRSFIHLERYVNSYAYRKLRMIGDVSQEYSSFRGEGKMNIPLFRVDKNLIKVSETNIKKTELTSIFLQDNIINFPIHPQVLEEHQCPHVDELVSRSLGFNKIEAEPTASMRTVFIENNGNSYFIKLHFPKRISSLFRCIMEEDVERGRWMSNELKRLCDKKIMPKEIGFYPEILGLLYKNKGSVGAILRDFDVYPKREKDKVSIPLCSLYSKDIKCGADRPLIFQLAEIKNKRADDYFIEEIVDPHLRQWVWLAFEAGILFNSHGQNVVLQFDKDWNIVRMDYRDFQGRLILPKVRERRGHPLPENLLKRETEMDVKSEMSLCFDFMIGERLYHRFMEPLSNEGYHKHVLRGRIKEIFHNYIHDVDKYFPKTMLHYGGVGLDRKIIDTLEEPKYR